MDTLKYNRTLVLVITIFISLLFLYMLRGLLLPIVLAAIFAGLLFPFYQKLVKRTGKPSLSSALTLTLFIAVIVIPGVIVLIELSEQADQIITNSAVEFSREIEAADGWSLQSVFQYLPPEFAKYQNILSEKFAESAGAIGKYVVSSLKSLTAGTADFFLSGFIFLFVFFYFLKDGKDYLNRLFYFLPFDKTQKHKLQARFIDVSKATINGTLVLNAIQGVVGAIGMYFTGVPNPVFWGLVLAIASIIPGLGTMSVWGPAAIYLAFKGDYTNAAILLAYGFLVISKVDNILRPKLVGQSAGMPDLMIFLSTMGGLSFFGLSGIILGPLVAAMFMFIWGIYGKAFAPFLTAEDENQQPVERHDSGSESDV